MRVLRRSRASVVPLILLATMLLAARAGDAGEFHVAPDGDDAHAGSTEAPFRTLKKGMRMLKPGDTLYVKDGTYKGVIDYGAFPSGTSWDKPTTVAAHPGHRPVIVPPADGEACLYIVGARYLIFDGFILDSAPKGQGVGITWGTGFPQANHIELRNCEIKNSKGQGILTGGDGCRFVNLDVHDNGTDGLTHGIYLNGDRNFIDGGRYYRNVGWGVHVYPKATNTIVRNTRCFENGATGLGLVWGSNNVAYNNIVYANGSGIHLSGDSPRAYNNTVYGNKGEGLSVANPGNGARGTKNADVRNNIVYRNDGGDIADYAKGAGTTLANNLTDDPTFVDAATGDFRLRETSPAIDAGADLRSAGVTADHEGTPRPRGKAFDLGAYERAAPRQPARGPLKVHPDNGRYFTDGTKSADGKLRAVYLTGSHTWPNLIDRGPSDPPPAFDFDWYLRLLEKHDHNFIRLWSRHVTWYHDYGDDRILHAGPLPWPRTGPGNALDGKPRFDLTKFNDDYFDRLRSRVAAAGDRGIYVGVMFFGGSYECKAGWRGNPFNAANNVNGIDGDVNRDGHGFETQTLDAPADIKRVHEAYVRKVIDTVNDLDNALFEISNESDGSSKAWQRHLIKYIHEYEKTKPKQHPVGMTALMDNDNEALYASDAEWVSPSTSTPEGLRDLPPADGRKVSLLDSDHWFISSILKNETFGRDWVWQAFCNGHNPILMENLLNSGSEVPITTDDPGHVASRTAMGHARRFADRMNLAAMTPQPKLSSTGYCLAALGGEYLVYQPKSEAGFTLRLESGPYDVEWFDPSARATAAQLLKATGETSFKSPFTGASVLYLRRRDR